jgi:hypothetical protein
LLEKEVFIMPVIGLNMNTIEAGVKNRVIKGRLDVNSTPTIISVEKKTVLDMDVLNIGFRFETKYQPDIANILIEGDLLYKTDDAKKILKRWKEYKKLEEDVAVEILNVIFRRCLTMAVMLSEDVGLPPPLNFPVVKPAEGQKEDG